jgi:cytochrome c oxidase subunit 4
MAEGSVEDIKKHVRVYYAVFGTLAVLTVLTVAASFLPVPSMVNLSIALFIATVKASLVACYFMHLISEKQVIYWVLALCALFFVVLILVPVLTQSEAEALTHVS